MLPKNVVEENRYKVRSDSRPIQKVDTATVRGVCEALEVGLEDLIQFEEPAFTLRHLDRTSQKELDRLMEKNNQMKLTQKERAMFEALLQKVQQITVHNAKILSDQKRLRESKQSKALVPL